MADEGAKKTAADVSGGSSSTRRAGDLLPLPRIEKPAAPSRASRGSPSLLSEASEGAAFHAAGAEGMGNQELLAEEAVGGRGGRYLRRSSCPDRSSAATATHHRSTSPHVSSRGEGYIFKKHGGGDASSFVDPALDEDFSTRANRNSALILQNIKLQAAPETFLLDENVEIGDPEHVDAIVPNEKEREVDVPDNTILSEHKKPSALLLKIDEMSQQGRNTLPGNVSISFGRRLHSSRSIILVLVVVCFACLPTTADGFRVFETVDSAADALRGLPNINELRAAVLPEPEPVADRRGSSSPSSSDK